MRWISVVTALLGAGCLRVPEDPCASYLERLCACERQACEAARLLLPALVARARAVDQDPRSVCRTRLKLLRCGSERP